MSAPFFVLQPEANTASTAANASDCLEYSRDQQNRKAALAVSADEAGQVVWAEPVDKAMVVEAAWAVAAVEVVRAVVAGQPKSLKRPATGMT